jgi:hypothetical protein
LRRFLFACVVALGVALTLGMAPAADAQSLRHPKTGEPAMVLDVPAGWTGRYDDFGNLRFSNVDRTLNIQLNMMVSEGLASISLAALAADMFKKSKLPPYTRTQPGSISGRAGEAFFLKKIYDSGVAVNFMFVLVRLGPSTVASLARVTRDGLTAAQEAPADDAIGNIRLIGVE